MKMKRLLRNNEFVNFRLLLIPGYCVFYDPKDVVMRSNSPPFLVGGIRHIQLSIFLVIGMECKA